MPVITATQVIERPIEEVFSTIADAAKFHESLTSVEDALKIEGDSFFQTSSPPVNICGPLIRSGVVPSELAS